MIISVYKIIHLVRFIGSTIIMKILTTHWLRMNFARLCSYCTTPQPSKISALGNERKHSFSEPKSQVRVSRSGKIYNFIGCLVAAALYCYTTLYWSDYLYTFDTIITVYLAEQCGWDNERVRRSSQRPEGEKSDVHSCLSVAEKGEYYIHPERSSKFELGCIAAIVGYREDPAIFTKALESYMNVEGCQFVLTCIDGNEAEDQVMVDVFRKVCRLILVSCSQHCVHRLIMIRSIPVARPSSIFPFH
jgi:hyaluronan synthase